jgi:hypothetical protein
LKLLRGKRWKPVIIYIYLYYLLSKKYSDQSASLVWVLDER